MKNYKYLLISFCAICGVIAIALVVNVLFKIKTEGIFSAEWSAGDALNYVGAMAGSISTFVLSLVAFWQNEKLKEMENNSYIAANSCMVLIDEVQIKLNAFMPVNYELHSEQILQESGNKDEYPSGYRVEIKLKKISESVQATPSLIYVSDCMLFVGNHQANTLESTLCLRNVRIGYTRAAILESGIALSCTLLVSRNTQEKFENNIKVENNRLTIEIQFNIITDKNVMTKCKCRACCSSQNSSGSIVWKSEKPMVFFYGHELKGSDEISVL